MDEYIIVAWFKRPKETVFKRTEFPQPFPLHMTIVGVFYTSLPTQKIVEIINGVCSKQKQFSSRGMSRELYGPNRNVPVTTVLRTEEIHNLHKYLVETLSSNIKLRIPEYNNENYSPHISDSREGTIEPHDELNFVSLSLVKLTEQELKIVHSCNLQDA